MPNKVLDELNSLEKSKKTTNTVLKGAFVVIIVVIVCFSLVTYQMFIKASKFSTIGIDRNGDVKRLERISDEERLEIEIKCHIDLFFSSFYTFNQNNLEKQIEKALWLGDESLESLREQFQTQDWYNHIIMLNIEQYASVIDSSFVIDISEEPYHVSVSALVYLRKKSTEEVYQIDATCSLDNTTRVFPQNPHGLFIRNWRQSLIRLQNQK